MLTVAKVEEVIEARIGGFIAQVREITGQPDQPSILESASWSLRKMGYTVADVATVTDDELGEVSAGLVDVVLDLAELRTLRSLPGNLPAIDVVTGPMQTKLSNLLPALEVMIKRRGEEIANEHGSLLPGSAGGRRRARVIYP